MIHHDDHPYDDDDEDDDHDDGNGDDDDDQVKWRTVAGTAVEGEDYEGAEGELVYTRLSLPSSSSSLSSLLSSSATIIVIVIIVNVIVIIVIGNDYGVAMGELVCCPFEVHVVIN